VGVGRKIKTIEGKAVKGDLRTGAAHRLGGCERPSVKRRNKWAKDPGGLLSGTTEGENSGRQLSEIEGKNRPNDRNKKKFSAPEKLALTHLVEVPVPPLGFQVAKPPACDEREDWKKPVE